MINSEKYAYSPIYDVYVSRETMGLLKRNSRNRKGEIDESELVPVKLYTTFNGYIKFHNKGRTTSAFLYINAGHYRYKTEDGVKEAKAGDTVYAHSHLDAGSFVFDACGKRWEMDELGVLHAKEGETEFSHIPDWYAWEREQVRREILEGTYKLDVDVKIGMLVDTKNIYMVGDIYFLKRKK